MTNSNNQQPEPLREGTAKEHVCRNVSSTEGARMLKPNLAGTTIVTLAAGARTASRRASVARAWFVRKSIYLAPGDSIGFGFQHGLARWLNRRSIRAVVVVGSALCLAAPGQANAAPSALSSPVRTIRVAWGEIGYRSVGSGRPLLLLTGTNGTLDTWPASFIDVLAKRHRVIAIDNEGVGRTTLRPGLLTVTRMASDAADFIRALRLHRVDVLGHSMGGFIAQVLAVRHPKMVRRLVLASTSPGDGRAVLGRPGSLGLFPPDQQAARAAFVKEILRYPNFYVVSPSTSALQYLADLRWLEGRDRAGHHIAKLRLPVLIGDGAEDPITPPKNSRILHAEIPHSSLRIYPDAAHLFLFQDAPSWIALMQRFLG